MSLIVTIVSMGLLSGVLILANSILSKGRERDARKGLAGLTIIAIYLMGHYLSVGLPDVMEKGMKISTEGWTFLVALFSIIPLAFVSSSEKIKKISYGIRLPFLLVFVVLVLQIPFISSTWVMGQSIVIVSLIALLIFLLWLEMDRLTGPVPGVVPLFTALNLSLSVTLIMVLSNTFTLGILSGLLVAYTVAMITLHLVLPKFGLSLAGLNQQQVNGFIFVLSLFFILEGYFFADVPIYSVMFIGLSVLGPGIARFIVNIKSQELKVQEEKLKKREQFLSMTISSIFSIAAIAIAGVMNI